MKKPLKEYRKINNLSQQELSDASGVSIRTIQRIEKKLSQGSPFILKSLCKSLNIEVSDLDLTLSEEVEEEATQEESIEMEHTFSHSKLINLSALAVVFLPLLNLIIPLLLFLKLKKQEPNKAAVLKILSFQIFWTLITLFLMVLIPAMLTPFFEVLNSGRFPFFVVVYYGCVVVNVFFTIDTAIKLNQSRQILTFVPNIL
jgi:transcriptional regulator with XRE-family HTH domain